MAATGAAAPARVGSPLAQKGVALGTYHALVIGNNDYKILRRLRTAVNDAREVARILERDYGFKVTLLLNATRYDTLSALNTMRERLTEKDNLLIYYAGHGEPPPGPGGGRRRGGPPGQAHAAHGPEAPAHGDELRGRGAGAGLGGRPPLGLRPVLHRAPPQQLRRAPGPGDVPPPPAPGGGGGPAARRRPAGSRVRPPQA